MSAVGIAAAVVIPAASAGASGRSGKVTAAEVGVGLGTSRSLPSGYYGVNYDYGGKIASSDDTAFATQLAALSPGIVRWPAGTGANYFVWDATNKRGAPTTDTTKVGCTGAGNIPNFYFTLSDLVAEYKATNAPPVFDLDITNCAAAPGQTALQNQLSFLRQASAAGVPIDYIELGNEFYLCETDYTNDFASPAAYADTAFQWVQSLHAKGNFPNAQVAVVASGNDGSTTGGCGRATSWNDGLVPELLKDAGKNAALLPNAYTVHSHPQFPAPLTTSNLPNYFDTAYGSVSKVSTDVATSLEKPLSGVQKSPREWLTEIGYFLNSGGNEQTYADTLFNSVQALLLAPAMPDSKQTDFWSAFGPKNPYAYITDPKSTQQPATVTLTPDGQAMTWIDQAAQGASAMAPLTFHGGPVLTGSSDSALVGDSFTNATSTTEVLVNLTNVTQTVQVGTAVPKDRTYSEMSSKDPTVPITLANTSRSGGTTSVAKGLPLAPYSVTIVN